MTIEKWIGYEEDGSLSPRGRGTPDRIKGFELWDNETPTQNKAIRVLTYTSHKWIVDPNPIKVQPDWHICTHENTWLRKASWDPLQWTWRDPYAGQGSIPSLSSNSQLDWVGTSSYSNRPRVGCCKGLAHIPSSSHNYHQVLAENPETTTREANYHVPMAINT